MTTVFHIDGGAGRVITAIPALLKYAKNNPNKEWYITVYGWDSLLWGIPELQDRVFNPETKGVFDNIYMKADKVITPEPYRLPDYYKQKISLIEAFDREINQTDDHSDLEPPKLILSKGELKNASNWVRKAKEEVKKKYAVVVQPFGRGARVDEGEVIDDASRSLDPSSYIDIVRQLSSKYCLIFFGEEAFRLQADTYTYKMWGDLRYWAGVIQSSDYFLGVDSLGQHMARALNKPGTVILGSTFAINTTYPNYFQILEKKGINRKYSPIRISNFDAALADRLNENAMKFTKTEINEMVNLIDKDIQRKVGK